MKTKKWLIDVEHYKDFLERFKEKLIEFGKMEAAECVKSLIKGLKLQPAVDAVEVVHGHWVPTKYMIPSVMCSECSYTVGKEYEKEFKYCPSCGTRMDAKEE